VHFPTIPHISLHFPAFPHALACPRISVKLPTIHHNPLACHCMSLQFLAFPWNFLKNPHFLYSHLSLSALICLIMILVSNTITRHLY
jgi:hypothetical protein